MADPEADPRSVDCSPTAVPATLAPGASFGCSAGRTVTQADVDAGAVSNTATVTGEDPGGAPIVDDSDDPDDPTNDDPDGDGEPDAPTVTPLDQLRELHNTKSDLLSDTGVAGDTIIYTITVANTGTVTVTDIGVVDPTADPGSADCSSTELPALLAPGGSFLCTATHTVTQADVDAGSVVNTATTTGEDLAAPRSRTTPTTLTIPPTWILTATASRMIRPPPRSRRCRSSRSPRSTPWPASAGRAMSSPTP